MIKKLAALTLTLLTAGMPGSQVAWADPVEKNVAPVSMGVPDVGAKVGPMDRAITTIVKFDSGRFPRLMDRSLPLLRRVFGVSPSREFNRSASATAAFNEENAAPVIGMPVADIKEGESPTHAPQILGASEIAVRAGTKRAKKIVVASAEEQQALLKNLRSGRGNGESARATSGRPFGDGITRRKFLTGVGVTAGAVALAACVGGGCSSSNYTPPPPPTRQVWALGYLDVTSADPIQVVSLFNNGFTDTVADVDVVYNNDNLFVAHQAFNPNATGAYFRTGVPSNSDYPPGPLKPFAGISDSISNVFGTLASLPIDLAVAAKVMTLQDGVTWIMFHTDTLSPYYVPSPYAPSAWIHWLTSPNELDIRNTLNVTLYPGEDLNAKITHDGTFFDLVAPVSPFDAPAPGTPVVLYWGSASFATFFDAMKWIANNFNDTYEGRILARSVKVMFDGIGYTMFYPSTSVILAAKMGLAVSAVEQAIQNNTKTVSLSARTLPNSIARSPEAAAARAQAFARAYADGAITVTPKTEAAKPQKIIVREARVTDWGGVQRDLDRELPDHRAFDLPAPRDSVNSFTGTKESKSNRSKQ